MNQRERRCGPDSARSLTKAHVEAGKTPLPLLVPLIYGSLAGTGVFSDITLGNNGAYGAKQCWGPATGWGTPKGVKLLHALEG